MYCVLKFTFKSQKEKGSNKDIGRLQSQLIKRLVVLQCGPTFFSLYEAYIQILDFLDPPKFQAHFL